ncbi:MAG TPA: protein TolR [Candidatus Competibacteraceae bacterium]|nr:protein TolR [Candidatus Competibacteraceae bacterium]
MARYNRRPRRLLAEINVVPYIDVMLVLLVIFMVTAPLLQQGVEVDLPKADAKALPADQPKPLILSVDRQGNYYLNLADNPGKPMDNTAVQAFVAEQLQRNPKLPVMVRADESVNYGTVTTAMVLLQQAGAPKVGLLTETPRK